MNRLAVMTCVLLGAVAIWLVFWIQPASDGSAGVRIPGPSGAGQNEVAPSPALELPSADDRGPPQPLSSLLSAPVESEHAGTNLRAGSQGITLRVVDEQGRPIAGAVAFSGINSRGGQSQSSEEDGLISLHEYPVVVGALWVIEVFAARYEARVASLPAELVERARAGDLREDEPPLTVSLTTCASLAVDVFAAGGAADGLTLFLSLDLEEGGLFGGERGGNDQRRLSLGASRRTVGSWSDASGGVLGFPLQAPDDNTTGAATDARSALLACVQPGFPLRVHLEDDYGAIVRSAETIVLQAGEARDVQWVLEVGPATHVVDIVDPWGVPVERAMVSLEGRGPNNRCRLLTDVEGRVRFEQAYGHGVRGKVSRDGYVPSAFEELAHDPAQGPLRLVLSPARDLTVDVVCQTAADLHVRGVSANLDGVRVRARQRRVSSTLNAVLTDPAEIFAQPPGSQPPDPPTELKTNVRAKASNRFVLEDVPTEAFPIRITALGRSIERQVPADVEACVVELPGTGSLDVTWAGALPDSNVVLELSFDSGTSEEAPLWIEALAPAARDAGLLVVPYAFPGSYRARLIAREPAGIEHPGPWQTVVVLPARSVSVVLETP